MYAVALKYMVGLTSVIRGTHGSVVKANLGSTPTYESLVVAGRASCQNCSSVPVKVLPTKLGGLCQVILPSVLFTRSSSRNGVWPVKTLKVGMLMVEL